MKRISVLFAGLALSVVSALPASATVFYSQAVAPDRPNSAWTSETANGVNGIGQAWEDFTLSADATVSYVTWTGWINPSFGQINSFTISFYEDGAPGPGTFISSTTITGNANQTDAGTPRTGVEAFTFSATIPDFTAVHGVKYWISIVADPDLINVGSFNWANSNQGDGSFYENGTDTGFATAPIATDLAFTLGDGVAATPEPSSLMLAGSGMLALVGAGRRRFIRG